MPSNNPHQMIITGSSPHGYPVCPAQSPTPVQAEAKDLNPDTISYYGNYYGGLSYGYGCKYGYTSGFGAFRILDCGYRCGCGGL
ncbi:PREDICTED: keratin-associated protein 20-3 [Mandrillus leucophaeus]|uniref:keratin-associated protein 20-3 n=1 Tax=Mandrillus leucophaeus TaxID=9568 RepID=UPI0005F37A19|nr:PREDICTED: keratin-associated protein 20-3 [Mandrillus leucophaeus]